MVLLGVLAVAGFAQIGGDGITASVSRTSTLAPDEAAFNVVVSSALGVTRQQISDALQTAGLPASSLTAAVTQANDYSYPPDVPLPPTQLYYQFSFSAPATDLNTVNQKLEALRGAPPDPLQVVRYQSYLQVSGAAIETERQRVLPLLLADARKRADTLAAAAGLRLGAIAAVNDSSYVPAAISGYLISSTVGGFSSSSGSSGGLQPVYTLSVKFAVN